MIFNWFFNWEIGPTSTPSSSMFAGMAMPTMAKTNANTKITYNILEVPEQVERVEMVELVESVYVYRIRVPDTCTVNKTVNSEQ